MASFPQVRRILHMHPAHRTVGVSGVASSFRSYSPVERPFGDEPAAASIRVRLVSRTSNKRAVAAIEAFKRVLAGNCSLIQERVDFAAAEIEGLANADCSIVLGRGLQIIGRWSALDASLGGEVGFEEDEGFDTEVEVAAAAKRHPIVDGVGRFITRHRFSYSSHLHPDSTCLLVRKWEGKELPVAWAKNAKGRAFYTLLSDPEDFGRRDFVRLLTNAIEWTGADYRFRHA
jgi:hypothetical protein